MLFTANAVRFGEPLRHASMSVFPLFSRSTPETAYELSASAMKRGAVVVGEVEGGGRVPDLRVVNKGPKPVLFLEGETLEGAKQNRILNVSILVPEGEMWVPVSCVEQGRWRSRSRHFAHGDKHVSAKMKYRLKRSVLESLKHGHGYRSHQGEVWKGVHEHMVEYAAPSATYDYAEVHASTAKDREGYERAFRPPEGCTGFAVAIGGAMRSLDLFGTPAACRSAWSGALSGLMLDALVCERPDETPRSAAASWLAAAARAEWEATPPLGLGERRQASFDGHYGSELLLEDEVVHFTLSAPDETETDPRD